MGVLLFPMSEKGCFKLAVVGGGGVGKSALTLQLVKQQFCEEYDPTIEDSHRKQVEIDGEVTLLEIFDTAGQEELSALRVAEGFLVVFSLTEATSFKQVEGLHGQICRAKDSDKVPIVIVGNKSDLTELRAVSEAEIQALTSRLNVKFFEASAKKKINVEESFFELVRMMRLSGTSNKGTKSGDGSSKKAKSKPGCLLL